MPDVNKRAPYACTIAEVDNKPEFRITVNEGKENEKVFTDKTARGVWLQVIKIIEKLRRENDLVKVFLRYVTGEDLFGLNEANVVKVLESLPGNQSTQSNFVRLICVRSNLFLQSF
jgi:histone-lysine N-methyltransferase MLL3